VVSSILAVVALAAPSGKQPDTSPLAPGSDDPVAAACAVALASSESAHQQAARSLGVDLASFAVHESPSPWRKMLSRTVAASSGDGLRDSIYYVEPKSAHSTIVNHLMKGGAFEKAEERWDARHHVATTSALDAWGAKPADHPELTAGSPFQWTVVREPLDHFIAGFDEVEFFYSPKGAAAGQADVNKDPKWRDSAWLKLAESAEPVSATNRAAAMLADLLAQRGPQGYLDELVHIVPQSLGFGRAPSSPAGGGFAGLDFVGHMEALGSAWAHVLTSLGVDAPAQLDETEEEAAAEDAAAEGAEGIAAEIANIIAHKPAHAAAAVAAGPAAAISAHVNPQQERRKQTALELRALMDADEFLAPTDVKEGVQATAETSGVQQPAAGTAEGAALVGALCALLEREYACLDYGSRPRRCAWAR